VRRLTPAGTSTPAIRVEEGPTMRGDGLTTPEKSRSDSLMTAVYGMYQSLFKA
jgi:hypothetical protein